MDILSLKATARNTVGKSNARRMRHEGVVPAIVYGHGENIMCSIAEGELRSLLLTPKVYLVDLDIDGKVEKVVLKDVQFHPVTDRPLHLDFYRYAEDRELAFEIPIVLAGHAKGVKAGGKLIPGIRRLKVKGLPSDFPNVITVDISNLQIGDVLLVEDFKLDKLTIVDTKTLVIAAIKSQRAGVAMVDEEEEDAEEATPAAEESSEA